jgi:cytochrome c-type biogenesis protein CcmH/NrfG
MSRNGISSPRVAGSRLLRSVFGVLPLAGSLLLQCASGGQAKNHPAISPSESNSEYVGSLVCSKCHVDIYRKFSQTSMGRSMSLVTPQFLDKTPTSASFVQQRLNRRFDVYMKDGNLYQSEAGMGADSKQTFQTAHRIEWIIGAGVNGFGGILQEDKHLFQAPLSFYIRPKSWASSPGYEFTDLGFNRPITPGCIFCHSGRPNPVAGSNGQFESPAFSELAIGCENCHGPGAAHIKAMQNTSTQLQKSNEVSNAGIVNPARLTPYLVDNICMACHQTGDARVLKPGKTFQDIRPGRPLDETLSIMMVPPTRESPPSTDHVEHYYSMTLSRCYRASQGRLSCITCHDPHVEPKGEEVPKYFAARCLTCHTNQSCKLPIETRMQKSPPNNCIGCHMPKRDIQVISHSSATNHRIVATPDEPFPDVTFQQTTASLTDLIHLNPAPGKESIPPPLLTLLAAYGELIETKPEYIASYLKVLGQLEKTQPDDPLVQSALGRKELKDGNYAAAVSHLRRALENGPPVATTYSDLAEAMAHLGQTEEALQLFEKAINLDPFDPITRKKQVVRLIETKQYGKAHEALEHYLEIFPQDDFMRQMLARAGEKSPQP